MSRSHPTGKPKKKGGKTGKKEKDGGDEEKSELEQ